MVVLSELEIITAIFSTIQSIIYISVGLLLCRKYMRYREKKLLMMGLCMIFFSAPWWNPTFNLILILSGKETFGLVINILITLSLTPLTIFLWMYVMAELMWPNQKKKIIIIMAIYAIIFQILVFYAAFVDPHTFAVMPGPFDIVILSWLSVCILIALILVFFSSILFFKVAMKSPEAEHRLKGFFVLLYGVLFSTITFIDALLVLSLIPLLITRLLLILVAFFIYIAFALPDWIKNLFIKSSSE